MMRLEELLPDILRRWWVIALAAAIAAIVGYMIADSEDPEYSVSVRLIAVAEPADYWLDLYAKNRLATYEPMINNYAFIQQALSTAGLQVDPSQAQQALTVSHASDRNTLTISVVDADPQRAADIANAVQAAFLRLNEEQNETLVERVETEPETFASRVVLTAVETAGPPANPIGNNAKTTGVAAGILGAILGGLVVVLLIYRDDSLRSSEDLERHIGRPLLAIVPYEATTMKR